MCITGQDHRPFTHFYSSYVISLATGKMVPVLARKQEQQKGQRILSITFI